MIILRLSECKYLASFSRTKLTSSQFLLKCNVKENSFAADFMLRIYNTFFNLDIDLESIYIKYYSEEYTDLEEFLYKKYLINIEDIELLIRNTNEGEKIYYIDLLKKADYGISGLINDELIEKINNIVMEVENENKNGLYY